ncbi:hypothetical protein [Ectobacillus panaciterrae]|uniref:hypothetical protein n=1 Tax=Ectobacillus panaciterrae TaxID=363872 RepID=UPI0004021672|nr:hypothetical protein [Ectobacillus panaciterrae]
MKQKSSVQIECPQGFKELYELEQIITKRSDPKTGIAAFSYWNKDAFLIVVLYAVELDAVRNVYRVDYEIQAYQLTHREQLDGFLRKVKNTMDFLLVFGKNGGTVAVVEPQQI